MSEEATTSVQLIPPNIDAEIERKKPRLEVLLFCHYASLDKKEKGVFVGCFDRLFVNPETKQSGTFAIVARLGEARKGRIVISILNPANVLIGNIFADVDVDRPLDEPTHVQVVETISFEAKEPGVYWIDVSYNGESLGGTSLTVVHRSPSGQKAESEK